MPVTSNRVLSSYEVITPILPVLIIVCPYLEITYESISSTVSVWNMVTRALMVSFVTAFPALSLSVITRVTGVPLNIKSLE